MWGGLGILHLSESEDVLTMCARFEIYPVLLELTFQFLKTLSNLKIGAAALPGLGCVGVSPQLSPSFMLEASHT